MTTLSLVFPPWIRPEIVPGLPFRWYGLMYVLAFAVTWFLFRRQIRQEGAMIGDDDIASYFLWAILGVLIGGRLVGTLVYDTAGFYLRRPWLIFWPFQNGKLVGLAGMSYHGGLIGAVLACIGYTTKKRFETLRWGDWLVAGIPWGYTFGRLGNFINGELWGRVTVRPWGMIFPGAPALPLSDPSVAAAAQTLGMDTTGLAFINLPRHPSQLYEALFEGVLNGILVWFLFRRIKRERGKYHGYVVAWYLIGYAVARILVEYVREPDPEHLFVLGRSAISPSPYFFEGFRYITTGQIFSFAMIAAGVLLHILAARRAKKSVTAP